MAASSPRSAGANDDQLFCCASRNRTSIETILEGIEPPATSCRGGQRRLSPLVLRAAGTAPHPAAASNREDPTPFGLRRSR